MCATVCRGWHRTLDDVTLWARLDLSPASGVASARVTDVVLSGAAAKARGGLTSLCVCRCRLLTHDALLKFVTDNAGALTELRACRNWWRLTAENVEALLGVAPLLRVCHADVQTTSVEARRLLRNEPPFGRLRLHELCVTAPWPGGEADVVAVAADVKASASSLSELYLVNAPLNGGLRALDAVVDAALACRLTSVHIGTSPLSAASVPALVRLLSGSALNSLFLEDTGNAPLLVRRGPLSSAAGCGAAREQHAHRAGLVAGQHVARRRRRKDAASSAGGAPQRETLMVGWQHRARCGTRACGCVARSADCSKRASAAHDVSVCALGDEGLGPLVDALPANTHLRDLRCRGNDMSDAFALQRLRPALLANTSLHKLTLFNEQEEGQVISLALRQMVQLVAERSNA